MKEGTWIIVANSAKARIFKAETNNLLTEIDTIDHPESREPSQNFETDRFGRSHDAMSKGSHAVTETTSPKQQEALHFAKKLAEYLDHAWNEGSYRHLYLAAGPQFLGTLRQTLNSNVEKVVLQEISKDITGLAPEEIRTHLPYVL